MSYKHRKSAVPWSKERNELSNAQVTDLVLEGVRLIFQSNLREW